MKTHSYLCISACLLALAFAHPVQAQQDVNTWGIGLRNHVKHSTFTLVPFNEDLSYEFVYDSGADGGYWQIVLGYTPHITASEGKDAVDYVVTPQLNLLMEDVTWRMRGGVGAVSSYVSYEDKGGDWTKVYWQFIAGLNIPLGSMHLDIMAYYVFEDWNELKKYDSKDIEFGATLRFPL